LLSPGRGILTKEQLIAEKMNGGLRKKPPAAKEFDSSPPAAKEFDSSTWPFFRFCSKIMHFQAFFN